MGRLLNIAAAVTVLDLAAAVTVIKPRNSVLFKRQTVPSLPGNSSGCNNLIAGLQTQLTSCTNQASGTNSFDSTVYYQCLCASSGDYYAYYSCLIALAPAYESNTIQQEWDGLCSGYGQTNLAPQSYATAVATPAVGGATSTPSAGITSAINTPTATFVQTFPSSSPAANAKNASVGVSDSRIKYIGADWQTKSSSNCSSSQVETNNVAGESLSFTFTGTAVYMATAQSSTSGIYGVSVDDQAPVAVDGFANSSSPMCSYGWSAPNLSSGSHSVVVQLIGPSSKAPANEQSSAGFELDGFMITTSAGIHRVSIGFGIILGAFLLPFFVALM
jgi:hypothetical protein